MKVQLLCRFCSEKKESLKRAFCDKHWDMIPEDIRGKLFYYYRARQEYGVTKPVAAYQKLVRKCIVELSKMSPNEET